MADNLPQHVPQSYGQDDEIDLLALFSTLWDGKWNIIGAVALACTLTVGALLVMPSEFTAKTKMLPITSVEADRYRESNALGFFSVERNVLLTLFIEQLQDRRVLVDAVKSLGLLKREDFDSQAEYDFAVVEFADAVEILPPKNVDGTERGEVRLDWSVLAEYDDEELWLAALTEARDAAFENIRLALLDRFMTAVSVAEVKQAFKIEDLRAQMENAQADFDTQMEEFELRLNFQREDITEQMKNVAADFDKRMEEFELRLDFELEDVKTRIENALVDYDRKTANRLAFLREQAEIARKLGVAKNTIEAQTFATQSGVVANVQSDTPFYLRGYEAIDKEIELIESREDKKAFVSGLLELEQKQREILQDQTLARAEQEKAYQDEYLALERKLREIEQDQTLARASQEKAFLDNYLALQRQIRGLEQSQTVERAKALFAKTPVATGENFVAASMIVEGTEFDAKSSKAMILVLVALLSGLLASVYVLISSAMRNRQTAELQASA